MNRISTTLNEVLIGAVTESTPNAARDAMITAGKAPGDIVVLAGTDGIQELLSHDRGLLRSVGRLVRRVEALDGDGTGHDLDAAEADLRNGRAVMVVRNVGRQAAAPLSDLLRTNGVPHVHYVGRWTVADAGAVPALAC